jgi:single-stranded-DNA-specific exonuclease
MIPTTLNTTEKYTWKSREFFSQKDSNLQDYFFTKRKKLLNQDFTTLDELENTSLLSLLPKPDSMKDLNKAVERIMKAMESKEKITIFGDYDVDGTTSCALLHCFFEAIGYPVDITIPDRLTEGYGLNPTGLKRCVENGSKLFITVDNGIAALSACELARELGVDVIITDHHDIPPTLPKAFAILNPKQSDCSFPFKMLAGVGVAFYLVIALRAKLRECGLSHGNLVLRDYLDFVAIGTIADMAPLNGVNHILCKVGLEVLTSHVHQGTRPGLAQLLKFAGWDGQQSITASDIGFKIGPRLNAAGRLGNALRSVDVLITQNLEKAAFFASFLNDENTQRQQLEKQFTQEALEMVTKHEMSKLSSHVPSAFVLHQEHWHSGVVGLVASRVLEKFYRPTIVFGTLDGKLKGSGRSTHSFNLFAALNAVRHEFISFGGHFHAVGLTLEPHKLPWLKEYLQSEAARLIAQEDLTPPLYLDGELELNCVDDQFLSQLEGLEPYGIENARTKWLVGPVQIKHIKPIGKDRSQGHAKILVLEKSKEFWLTGFGMAEKFEHLLENGVDVQLVIEAKRRFWNEREYLDLTIVDFAPIVYLEK